MRKIKNIVPKIKGNISKNMEIERIDRILAKIRLIWEKNQDLKLWEVIGYIQDGIFDNPFHLNNSELERRLDKYIEKHG